MCGISVLVQKNGLPVDREKLEIINKSINHRGPDNEGYYIKGNFGLGHQRLSIIDLTDSGNQPMKIDQNVTIDLNMWLSASHWASGGKCFSFFDF